MYAVMHACIFLHLINPPFSLRFSYGCSSFAVLLLLRQSLSFFGIDSKDVDARYEDILAQVNSCNIPPSGLKW